MAEPWLTIIGLGEDGLDGLSSASRDAISAADVVAGSSRHLQLLSGVGATTFEWPVPFADGVEQVLAMRGQSVVVLASGDPFWFGAGAVFAARLPAGEWRAIPGPSAFSWAAARLGWRLEETTCLGLHAAGYPRLRPHLAPGARLLVTLRDGAAVRRLADYLRVAGFGETSIWIMEALGGPRERVRLVAANEVHDLEVAAPVLAGLLVAGPGPALPVASGRADQLFEHDGQITKSPIRAMTLAALAPVAGELLWDIGAGSGSISIEWLLAHPAMRAIAIEANQERAERAQRNAQAFGVDRLDVRLDVRLGTAPGALLGLSLPDAVFIGGGVDHSLLDWLWATIKPQTRVVANAVTLEAEALLAQWQQKAGGSLLRIDLAEALPLGSKRGWRSSLPIVQWRTVR